MHLDEGWEPLALMLPEVANGLVGIYAEELSDDLDGEDFGVGKLGQETTRAEGSFFDSVIDEAEDADDEGAKIRRKRPPSLRLGTAECREVLFIVQQLRNVHTG